MLCYLYQHKDSTLLCLEAPNGTSSGNFHLPHMLNNSKVADYFSRGLFSMNEDCECSHLRIFCRATPTLWHDILGLDFFYLPIITFV
ncbi:hypothetical protein SUGI_0048580 [Cryptomeria japonica]|nr:hypothetical protein SUGI_0048580 [Cryptomeria japonica]